MSDPVRALADDAAATLTIQQGTEHFDDGRITLTIDGAGAVRVEQQRAGATQRYQGQLDRAALTALAEALASHHFTQARRTSLPREPGDTPVALRFARPGSAPFVAELWNADRYRDRDLDAILRLADAQLHRASGGALGTAAAP